jgi:2-C-methyl-D-erythritol 2,4-cyclodiphosphate synthase
MPRYRIGEGSDMHRLVSVETDPAARLVLGGIPISHSKGAVGHSDADVLLHAVVDALLGAMGRRDIGTYFPDTDHKWKDASSLTFLLHVGSMLREAGYSVENIDATISAERPRLQPFLLQMRRNIAAMLRTSPKRVSVKAKTGEGIGVIGREEGIAAHAVVLLRKQNKLQIALSRHMRQG